MRLNAVIRNKKVIHLLMVVAVFSLASMVYRPLNVPSLNAHQNNVKDVFTAKQDWKKQWMTQRQELLSRDEAVKKVFLFAYMRGGSSLAGEIFNNDPRATMWYEPGDAFYSHYFGLNEENLPQNDLYFKNMTRRQADERELQAMSEYFTNMLSCQYDQLPPEALGHKFLMYSSAMKAYMTCEEERKRRTTVNECKSHISDICGGKKALVALTRRCHIVIDVTRTVVVQNRHITDEEELARLVKDRLKTLNSQIQPVVEVSVVRFIRHQFCLDVIREDNSKCVDIAIRKCKQDKVRVVQVNRMLMENLKPLIMSNPDIYLIHYIRDPRAIALSRHASPHLLLERKQEPLATEGAFVCHRMAEDLRQRHLLDKTFPGVVIEAKYEDLTTHPKEVAAKIYSFIDRSLPPEWASFVTDNMYSSKDDGKFGTVVKNATETAMKWQTSYPKKDIRLLTRLCKNSIGDLGYTL